jgi:hypothetical protein
MLYWTIQITVISIILIFLVHHLIDFFKTTLTVPKIKDLVNTPTQKYENMLNIIKKQSNTYNNSEDYKNLDLIPSSTVSASEEQPVMKNELKNFLKSQLNTNSNSYGTDIKALDNLSLTNSYSEFMPLK